MPSDERPTDPFSGIQILSEDAFRSLGSMEAIEWESPAKKRTNLRELVPGFALASTLTVVAIGLTRLLPDSLPLGAAVFAMVLGILFRNALPLSVTTGPGCRWIVAHLIPLAIVLVGAGLDLGILATEGLRFLGYVLAAVAISSVVSLVLGKLLGVGRRTALLIGTGTGICGSSAILALAPVIDAEEDDILLSVGAINLIGLAAMFACIGLASATNIPAMEFGILTGATIHAVPTVAAAAFDHSEEAGQIATLVKMGRVAMLVPFVLGVAIVWNRRKPQSGAPRRTKARRAFQFVPWFVWGFTVAAALGTLGLIPDFHFTGGLFPAEAAYSGKELLSSGGKLLLTLAMTAIGLQVGLKTMLKTGGRALLLAALLWIILAAVIILPLTIR